jgi:hypothetical protein
MQKSTSTSINITETNVESNQCSGIKDPSSYRKYSNYYSENELIKIEEYLKA